MAKYDFDAANTVIYDPVSLHGDATRAVLYTLGFRKIEIVPTLEMFSKAIHRVEPDLVLCEAQGAGVALCEMIHALRQDRSGYPNPFLAIIVTAWEKSLTLVSQVVNSGADDLILRPFSVSQLGARIEGLVTNRKRFVIAHDYVGPDRRNDPRRLSPLDLFQPPNSLRMKAQEGLSAQDVQVRLARDLRLARENLNNEKLRRDAFQICVLWRLLQDPNDPAAATYLIKLNSLTPFLVKRCHTLESKSVEELCASLQAAVEGLQCGVDRNAAMHLLGHAAIGLNQLVQPNISKGDLVRSVEQRVEMIRARSVGCMVAADPLLKVDAV